MQTVPARWGEVNGINVDIPNSHTVRKVFDGSTYGHPRLYGTSPTLINHCNHDILRYTQTGPLHAVELSGPSAL